MRASPAFHRYLTLEDKIERCLTNDHGCWLWPGHRDKDGYCQVGIGGIRYQAHRAVYELLVGPIGDDLTIDHLCKVTNCVNPSHLEPATMKENLMRGCSFSAINAKATHCPIGHPYDAKNTYRDAKGRSCRECSRRRCRARRAAQKQQRERNSAR